MEIRWLSDEEILEKVNPALQREGMALLNVNSETPTCRVLGAFEGLELAEFLAFQLFPLLGPLLKVSGKSDGGRASRLLAETMASFVEESEARGFLAVADSPVSERLCKRFGMEKLESPVYAFVRKEEGWAAS